MRYGSLCLHADIEPATRNPTQEKHGELCIHLLRKGNRGTKTHNLFPRSGPTIHQIRSRDYLRNHNRRTRQPPREHHPINDNKLLRSAQRIQTGLSVGNNVHCYKRIDCHSRGNQRSNSMLNIVTSSKSRIGPTTRISRKIFEKWSTTTPVMDSR